MKNILKDTLLTVSMATLQALIIKHGVNSAGSALGGEIFVVPFIIIGYMYYRYQDELVVDLGDVLLGLLLPLLQLVLINFLYMQRGYVLEFGGEMLLMPFILIVFMNNKYSKKANKQRV